MRLSIVILTRDRWPRLQVTVGRLSRDHPRVPIIVVDNDSADAPRAVERADTDLVAFCDDDAWWEPGALDVAKTRFEAHPTLGAVIGRVLVEPGGRLDPVSAQHEQEGRVTGFLATAA